MKHKLIIKIEKEQKLLEQKALRQGLKALGLNDMQTNRVLDQFGWLQGVRTVHEEVDTLRIKKCLTRAQNAYLVALEDGIASLEKPLTLQNWTRAGQAMRRVFRQAAKEYVRD